jgi:PTH1 family peptidyl-tRNA hydrolase
VSKLQDFKLIVGLGNPGNEFTRTRHNVGFMLLNYIADENNLTWHNSKKLQAEKTTWNNTTLLKPQTYMNKSGISVQSFCQKNGIKKYKKILVVHDELDLPLAEYKFSFATSSPSHKGVNSVEQQLGSDQFWRLRIGTENRGEKNIPGREYVLQKFNQKELEKITNLFKNIYNQN